MSPHLGFEAQAGPGNAPTILLTTKNECCTFIGQKSVIEFFKGFRLSWQFFGSLVVTFMLFPSFLIATKMSRHEDEENIINRDRCEMFNFVLGQERRKF